MIEQIFDRSHVESTPRGRYRVIEQVFKGMPDEINAMQSEYALSLARDPGIFKFETSVGRSFVFDHIAVQTVAMAVLYVTAVFKTDRLGG